MINRRGLFVGAAIVAASASLSNCAAPGDDTRPGEGADNGEVAGNGEKTGNGSAGSAERRRSRPSTGTLKVPGAQLYFETRGSGPLLLMIHGGGVDAGSFAAIAPVLAGHYRVLTYDRRGNSRSTLDGAPSDLGIEEQTDDAARLIDRFTDEPPYVFGSSGGANIALDLASRYPERLRGVVAHEPPVPEVLPDRARHRAAYRDVLRTYRRHGADRAMNQFMALDPGDPDPRSRLPYGADPELEDRIASNVELLIAHELLPFTRYRPRIEALKKMGSRLVIGVGRYKAEIATRIVETLAAELGQPPVQFAGDHTGYMRHPERFAQQLRRVWR